MSEEKKNGGAVKGPAFKKLAIVGTASSMAQTPWHDKTFDIWTIQAAVTYPEFKRADIFFEMHRRDYWNHPNVMSRFEKIEQPVYMQDKNPEVKNSIKYPLDEIIEHFNGCVGKKYFTSTIAYMLALAIYKQYGHIALFGIHMLDDSEYGMQRQACEYWIGIANGRGVDVFVTSESAITTCPYLYGYETEPAVVKDAKERILGLQKGIEQYQQEINTKQNDLQQQIGAIKDCEYFIKRYK